MGGIFSAGSGEAKKRLGGRLEAKKKEK